MWPSSSSSFSVFWSPGQQPVKWSILSWTALSSVPTRAGDLKVPIVLT